MGKHLTDLLLDAGYAVYVTTRKERESSIPKLTFLKGNAKELSFITGILKLHSWDVIVDFMVYNTSEFDSYYKMFLSATHHYLFLSSSRVYAESSSPIQENFPRLLDQSEDINFLRTDEYSLTKARQENLLVNSGKHNWTIIRPYITYSEERLQLGTLEKENWLYRALHGRTIVFSKDILNRLTTLTYGRDVAKGIMSIIGKSEVHGRIFHITHPQPILWEDVYQLYVQLLTTHLGASPKVKLVDLDTFLTLNKTSYQVLYDRMYNRIFSTKSINQYIDTALFCSPLDGLEECLKTFLEEPHFGHINWFAEARIDKICKERTPLKEIPTLKSRVFYLGVRYLPKSIIQFLWNFVIHLRKIIKF